jgi:ribonucleoside-triphosphate reductase
MMPPKNDEQPLLPEAHSGEGVFDAQMSLPLPAAEMGAPFQSVVKRDGRVEHFDRQKIADTIFKASKAAGVDDRGQAEGLASAVTIFLAKIHGGNPPTVDQVHDAVERVLLTMGHIAAALAYVRYRDRRGRIRRLREGDLEAMLGELREARSETAPGPLDRALLQVRTSGDRIAAWDRDRIVDALTLETGMNRDMAELVAAEVESQIAGAGMQTLTSSLVREMVGARLIEHGLIGERDRHRRLGVPLYDTARIVRGLAPETSGADPDATDRALARALKKEYALAEVFSAAVADAHLSGSIHLHDVECVDRLYGADHSLEYLVRYGVRRSDGTSFAGPPVYPDTLLAQWSRFDTQLDAFFSARVGWRAFNLLAAPFVDGRPDDEVAQLAQMTAYEAAYRAATRGNSAPETQIEICWTVPQGLRGVDAIGPGGEAAGRTWDRFAHDAQRFAWALVETLCEGEREGLAFPEPAVVIPIDTRFSGAAGSGEFLRHAARLGCVRGSFDFVLDRSPEAVDSVPAWRPRRVVAQRVSLNLPRAACLAKDEAALFAELDRLVNLAAAAHVEKRGFIEELLLRGNDGPLRLIAAEHDGLAYVTAEDAIFEIAVDGLWECAGLLAEGDNERAETARRIAERLHYACRETARQRGIRLSLTAGTAPHTARRFAALDAAGYPRAATMARVDSATQAAEYTPGAALPAAGWNAFERVRAEGAVHVWLDGGAISLLPLPGVGASERTVAEFVTKAFNETNCRGLRFILG